MIEQLIKDLIAAVNANTAAVNALAAAGGATTTAAATTEAAAEVKKPAKKAAKAEAAEPEVAKPEHTQAEVTAALVKIKDDFGIEHAREILAKYKYAKMADIKPEHFDAVFAEAEAKHAELTAEADNGDGGL